MKYTDERVGTHGATLLQEQNPSCVLAFKYSGDKRKTFGRKERANLHSKIILILVIYLGLDSLLYGSLCIIL